MRHVSKVKELKYHSTYLCHLQADNFGEGSGLTGDIPEIGAKNSGTVGVTTVGLDSVVAELCLLPCKCNTGDVAVVVLVSKGGESSPTTSNVEKTIFGLEVEFFTDDRELVVLQLFEGLFT